MLRNNLLQIRKRLETKELLLFNNYVKLGRRTCVIDDHKRLMMIISSGDVVHADAVMRARLRRKMSVHAIVGLFRKAADKLYAAKSFTEQEMGLGLLFLHLGGAQLAGIAHRSLGLPGVSTLQHACPTKPLLISSHLPTASELQENITVSLNMSLFNKESSILADALSETSAYVLMFDEIKIEEVMCYSATNNHIVSICCKHSGGYALEYSSPHKASQLFEGVKEGKVHIAMEVSTHMLLC